MKTNDNLYNAKVEKNDEFFTRYEDIEKELINYKEHFKDKVVYCNCDIPFRSNFVKYFSDNFNDLKIKKLFATSYRHNERGDFYEEDGVGMFPASGGLLKGNGSFDSPECVEILKKSDIIVTNPPFSLFKEYMSLLMKHNKKFLIIGNFNAITFKEIFPLIKENKIWLGYATHNMWFTLPDGTEKNSSSCWFTNLPHDKRNKQIVLKQKYNPEKYPKYDNYNAIEVSRVKDIPMDYEDIMGVPISFIEKYNPDQFEILWQASGNARVNAPSEIMQELGYIIHDKDKGGCCVLNGETMYPRVFIRKKK